MNYYKRWLQAEKEWIDQYCKKTRNMSLFVVALLILVVLAALFGGMELVNGSETSVVIESAAGGFFLGVFICIIYLLGVLNNGKIDCTGVHIRANAKSRCNKTSVIFAIYFTVLISFFLLLAYFIQQLIGADLGAIIRMIPNDGCINAPDAFLL